MDRVLPSEGRGCWFDPSRARHHCRALHREYAWDYQPVLAKSRGDVTGRGANIQWTWSGPTCFAPDLPAIAASRTRTGVKSGRAAYSSALESWATLLLESRAGVF